MKLLQLHEAGYAGAKTVERIMGYVDEDSSIVDGFVMKLNQPNQSNYYGGHIQYLSVQEDEEEGTPYMLVSFFGGETDTIDSEGFVEMVEVYATKRIL